MVRSCHCSTLIKLAILDRRRQVEVCPDRRSAGAGFDRVLLMIPGLIFAGFIAGLAQFFFYCHTALISARDVEVSAAVLGLASLENERPRAEDFGRLLQLVGLCPDFRIHRMEIRAVQDYYNVLRGLNAVTRRFAPSVSDWTERERADCSHFAAVILERRITYSRAIAAQRVSD